MVSFTTMRFTCMGAMSRANTYPMPGWSGLPSGMVTGTFRPLTIWLPFWPGWLNGMSVKMGMKPYSDASWSSEYTPT